VTDALFAARFSMPAVRMSALGRRHVPNADAFAGEEFARSTQLAVSGEDLRLIGVALTCGTQHLKIHGQHPPVQRLTA
jgi:hypothetical protein